MPTNRKAAAGSGRARQNATGVVATKTPEPRTALITGGSGFLGRHLVELLVERGYNVIVVDLKLFPFTEYSESELVKSLRSQVRDISVDIGNYDALWEALRSVPRIDAVFHCATASPTAANAANRKLMEYVNIEGTKQVIRFCLERGIRYLVYTSSASVVFAGLDLIDVDEESAPLAKKDIDFYTYTKRVAEQLVLQTASSSSTDPARRVLYAVALRPSGIFGEYDPLFIPTLVSRARQGRMKYIIGSGRNAMDWTYVKNVAEAHYLAAEALQESDKRAKQLTGKAYFITNGDPRSFWGFLGSILQGLGYPPPRHRLPFALVYSIAWLVVLIDAVARLLGRSLSTDFTPGRVLLATCERRVSCAAARRDLGYNPRFSIEDGLERTLRWFRSRGLAAQTEAPMVQSVPKPVATTT
jgi:sterol-4alpha-carboxylate 3-dehydrogenase (decarboxylating)